MRSIDIHTHILPPELPDFKGKYGYGGFIRLEHQQSCGARVYARMLKDDGTFFREIESNCWDPARRIEDCDRDGVRAQVLSTIPTMFSYWAKPEHGYDLSRFLNDHIAQVVAGTPERFVGLATLPMQSPKHAVAELERAVTELGMAGAQIGSHVNDWNLGDPELYPVFEAAERLDAAIFVHPWDMMGQQKMPKYWLPWLVGMPAEASLAICSLIFGGVFERLPRLRVAVAHGGGAFPGTIGRIEQGFDVRPDLCAVDNPINPRSYLGRFFVDSLVHDPKVLSYLIELFGENRVALGTDYPFPLGEAKPGELIESLKLGGPTREKLLFRNALEWLGPAAKKIGSEEPT